MNALFRTKSVEVLLAELEVLVERAFRRYSKAGAGKVDATPAAPAAEARA
jgi:hypothetical protein